VELRCPDSLSRMKTENVTPGCQPLEFSGFDFSRRLDVPRCSFQIFLEVPHPVPSPRSRYVFKCGLASIFQIYLYVDIHPILMPVGVGSQELNHARDWRRGPFARRLSTELTLRPQTRPKTIELRTSPLGIICSVNSTKSKGMPVKKDTKHQKKCFGRGGTRTSNRAKRRTSRWREEWIILRRLTPQAHSFG
jgi:hypothetical protein